MEYILSSLDMFAGISDNLINYTFNVSPRLDLVGMESIADSTLSLDDILRNE